MKATACYAAIALLLSGAAQAAPVYLSCTLPEDAKGHPAAYFDFTLDEEAGTVSFFVKEANAVNREKAVFGPETITWTNNSKVYSITRTINRVDMTFTQDTDIAGVKNHRTGPCELKKTEGRKF
jgi:hypothetical protein